MAILRFDPFRELDRWAGQAWGRLDTPAIPFDAVRRESQLELRFDLPGVDPASIDVTVEKGSLTVSAERHAAEPEDGTVVVRERPAGRFSRQLLLGDGLDVEQVQADYDAGVLTVVVPVADAVRPHRVQVHGVRPEGAPLAADTEVADAGVTGAAPESAVA